MILVLNPIINFVFYEAIKKYFTQKGTLQILVASSFGKLLATLATYPILTVRVKLQASKELLQSGMLVAVLKLLREMSLKEMYRGMSPKLL